MTGISRSGTPAGSKSSSFRTNITTTLSNQGAERKKRRHRGGCEEQFVGSSKKNKHKLFCI